MVRKGFWQNGWPHLFTVSPRPLLNVVRNLMTKPAQPAQFILAFLFIAAIMLLVTCSSSDVTPEAATQMPTVESPVSSPTSTPIPTSTVVVPTATLAASSTPAVTPQPIQETITIPVSGDTFIYAHPNASATNYGQQDTFTLGGDSDGNAYVALLDFDIFNYLPQDAAILEANLHITADETVFWGFPFTIHPITTFWDENIVVADSQPAYDATTAVNYNLDEVNQSMSFPVTEIVQKWVSGELDEYGLRLSANVFQTVESFYTREGNNQASSSLVVTFETRANQAIDVVDTEPSEIENDSFHLEPDLLLVLNPWEKLLLAMENRNIDTSTAAGTAEFANIVGLDLGTSSGMGQFEILVSAVVLLGFGNDRDAPIAIAEDPHITVEGILEKLPSEGFLGLGEPEIYAEDYSNQYWPGCGNELTCADSHMLVYTEGGLGIYVTDGFMLITMSGPPISPVDILDLVDVRYEGMGEGGTDMLDSILFFRIMHETFGIPYDSMEIYPYDGLAHMDDENFWPTKYMAIYWAGDGEFVVPISTEGDLSDKYDAILQYDIRINPPNVPFTFRRWFDPLNPGANFLQEPETELQLVLTPCSDAFCTKSLFGNDPFRAGYYEMGNYPYESIQIELGVEPETNMPYWLVGYLTDEPLFIDQP